MPFRSPAQRRLIYLRASQGTPWAKRFLKDMGLRPPKKVRRRASR